MFPGTFTATDEIKATLFNTTEHVENIEHVIRKNNKGNKTTIEQRQQIEAKDKELRGKLEELMLQFHAEQTDSEAHYRNFQCNKDDSGGAKWSRLYNEDDSSCHSKLKLSLE